MYDISHPEFFLQKDGKEIVVTDIKKAKDILEEARIQYPALQNILDSARIVAHSSTESQEQNKDIRFAASDREALESREDVTRGTVLCYNKVNLLGHSMGTAIAAISGCSDPAVGKIIYVSPSFENLQMTPASRILLKLLSPFTPKIRCKWHPSSKYHLHYENAPCDEMFFGTEYFRWFFTKKLGEYYRIMKTRLACISDYPHTHLVICPMLDQVISVPSAQLYRKAVGERENIIYIENAAHCIFYDKNPTAEEKAVEAVISFAVKD